MTNFITPYIINFKKNGESTLGYISIAEEMSQIPFVIKRVFWTYYTPEEVIRGKHAHYETEMVLIAAAGIIKVKTEQIDGSIQEFILDKPDIGLLIPKMCWHTMQYSHNAVQIVIASSLYNESDYIRSYESFKSQQI
jgi:hypothetical protein